MELTTNQVGMILQGMYMSDYFETENLRESLQQLIEDKDSTIGITIQTELPDIYTLLDQVNFEKRIPDFNERQIAFSVISDIYALLLGTSPKKDRS